MSVQLLRNRPNRRFFDLVPWVAGQIRAHDSRDRPTRPGPPPALLTSGFVHAARVVLEMHARISQENIIRRVGNEPRHRRVRERPLAELLLATREVCSKRAIETKNCARGETTLPQRMTVFEAGLVKFSATMMVAEFLKQSPVQSRPWHREVRARGKQRHARLVNLIHASVNA